MLSFICVFLEKKLNKTVNQRFGANSKKRVYAKFIYKFFAFLKLFSTKNAENDSFYQRLECAAPKRWSTYTTSRPTEKRISKFKRTYSIFHSFLSAYTRKHNITFVFTLSVHLFRFLFFFLSLSLSLSLNIADKK